MPVRSDLDALVNGCLMGAFTGPEAPPWLLERVAGGLGGICLFGTNVESRGQLGDLVARLREARADVVVAIDEEGGDVTRLHAATSSPHAGAATLGAADDVELTRAVAVGIGAELAAAGVDLDLAPCVDVNTDPANPVIGVRSFGPDPTLVARHGVAAVSGLRDAGVLACAKHFPGHGDTTVDSHLGLPVIGADRRTLRERELVPFRALIDAGVAAVMPSHLLVPALDNRPASVSHVVLAGVLRGELGFRGAVVTDALDMGGIVQSGGTPAAAAAAVVAGADLCCLGAAVGDAALGAVHAVVAGAARDGVITAARLEEAAARRSGLRARCSPGAPAHETPGWGARAIEASDVAARRALRVEGNLPPPRTGLFVVTCRSPSGIAVGDVPWGIAAEVARRDPSSRAVDASPATSAGSVLAAAGERPLVVVVRDAHRVPWQRALTERLVAARPDVVVVEMGWPAPATLPARIVTFGAAQPNARAAAARLVAGSGG